MGPNPTGDNEHGLDAIERDFAASTERAKGQRLEPRSRPRSRNRARIRRRLLSRKPPRRFALALAMAGAMAASAVGVVGAGVRFDGVRSIAAGAFEVPQALAAAPSPRESGPVWPARGALAAAEEIARDRGGLVSFAAIGPGRRELGFGEERRYVSASTVKAMLLVAELRRLEAADLPLDESTQGLLEAMITFSDNAAADVIYGRVGDEGLYEVAKLAGMRRFDVYGYWANAQITAADMAGFAGRLNRLLDLGGGEEGSRLLASVIPEQSWGIPEAAPAGATVRFKGGWRPTELGDLVHQVARVDSGKRSYSLAILTDGQPSMDHGEETIRLIARELLRTDRSRARSYPGGRGS